MRLDQARHCSLHTLHHHETNIPKVCYYPRLPPLSGWVVGWVVRVCKTSHARSYCSHKGWVVWQSAEKKAYDGENNIILVYSSPKVSRDILVSCFHQLRYKDLELLIAEIDSGSGTKRMSAYHIWTRGCYRIGCCTTKRRSRVRTASTYQYSITPFEAERGI